MVVEPRYGCIHISVPCGRYGEFVWDNVKWVIDRKRDRSRAKTGMVVRGIEIRDRDVSESVLAGDPYAESPAAVIPGRLSRRKDLSGGRESSVSSLNDGEGKDDTCKCSNDGRE